MNSTHGIIAVNMTRHARNCTAGAVYTYNEKKKDAQTSGYGSLSQRLGKDSIKGFDCCSLTLQPCRNPVITKDGYLFDREAVLEYVLAKKGEYNRKMKEFDRQKKKEESEQEETNAAEELKRLEKFIKLETHIVGATTSSSSASSSSAAQPGTSSSISNMVQGRDKQLPSFWVPSQTPSAGYRKLEKPDSTIPHPITGKPFKMKELIEVKFTLINDASDKKKSLIYKEDRYKCAVTHDVLNNSVPCAVLRPTGDVVTMECVEKIIKKDMIHPLTNEKLKDSDIIEMERGGTGYSTTNDNLSAKEHRPALQC